ncbi:MAG TPA: YezD family protein [Opitutaceae bacterium]
MTAESAAPANEPGEPEWLALVRAQVRGLRFGVVQLVVHDGRVTQIERTEKTRLDSEPVRPRRA